MRPCFLTLILQYLNKLSESKVGDFSSPQAFHPRKVQGFNGNRIKRLTKVACQLPLKVFALVRNFTIETCELSHTPPPTIRTFLLTTQFLVETPKFVQVRFQRLWVLFLLTRAQRQICVFHTEVRPNTLTRCRQRLRFYKVGYYAKPIVTTSVALDCDTANSSMKLTVFMKRISDFIISPFTVVPFSKGDRDTIVFQKPACLFECEGLELMPFLDFWSTTKFLEKSHIGCVNPFEFLLDRLTRQSVPMRVCRPLQHRHVRTHCSITRIGQLILIPLTLPPMKILMNLPHIVKQIPKPNTIGLIAKLILIRFHGLSSIKSLTPEQWVGPTRYQAVTLFMSVQLDTLIILHLS